MQWSNALSTHPSLESALRDVVDQAQSRLRTAQMKAVLVGKTQGAEFQSLPNLVMPAVADLRPQLAVFFLSAAFASEYSRVMPLLQDLLQVDILIGCSGGGIVGDGREIEEGPAVSLSLAVLPDVNLRAFHLESEQLPDLDAAPDRWVDLMGVSPQANPHFILLADGFSSRISELLQGLDYAYAGAIKVGGLASGGRAGNNALFLGGNQVGGSFQSYRSGVVGVALSGNIAVEAVVAQGCRPIGEPMLVTTAERNLILGLDDGSPLQTLQDMVARLHPEDQELVRHSLFLGLLMDEFKAQPEQGDFLIRVILGIDPRSGAIAIGDRIRAGQTVQFHLRDAATSAEDLRWVLQRYRQEQGSQPRCPAAALMFACLGRGEQLYNEPDFDSRQFKDLLGDMPLGGFFCNGEIGPVGGRTFLHGYTSSFGLFRALQ